MKAKTKTAALGFRVKSGWAAVVVVGGSRRSPRLCDGCTIDLCDPKIPATRQPYHAAMGKLETNQSEIDRRLRIVRRAAQKSVATLLSKYRRAGFLISRAGIVVGSQSDPESISNPHIRAHASEGRLFFRVLDEALRRGKIRTEVLRQRAVYENASTQLKKSSAQITAVIQSLGETAIGSWRAEQKVAAAAAWIALHR